ncbi:sugar translocase [Halobacillus halophilus]|uniref:Polysaccharide biosynthesis protein n=1 Tax=Halobacillus halophilus (strain ATCC 35676 / DSM 2266 / JCM 20832 / KCTC 3685 / LMG 17431 / NBRC 102448 / NCIMB 2269) TaxID=866895 RepID=I0JJM1_HALH3|nr:sugar translocase [Halobacillus halophilus]ASF38493.1 sugar translocase [Halobacillus halophilus]CCG44339.1 polysaccharide biosynthesis protein [Halobacillus halophilus DSM 2266]
MRIQNSLRNMFFGVAGQLITIMMGFIVRTVFIYTLGIEYVGIEGLFTSILLMLSLANLGFDTAMIYSLYKPLAEGEKYKIQALMNLYKKAYRIVGFVVLAIGLFLLPFLPYLINGKGPVENIQTIYILFLLQSAASYFFIYKQSILIADQRNHIVSKIHSAFIIISNSLQILLLVFVGSYILVLVTQLSFRVFENMYIAKKVDRLYPYLRGMNKAVLYGDEKKRLFQDLYSLFLYKISGAVINGTDNILISMFIGITVVGIYSNYLLLLSTLTTLLSYIFYSLTASVGNLIVQNNREKKYHIFRVIRFSNFWVYGLCSICLWVLLDPFISLWIGEQYLLGSIVVGIIILNFYTTGMQGASTTYRETTGLFKKGKYRPIIAAGLNLALSLILVRVIGLTGIFLGTIFSRLMVYFWYDPYIIYKYVFNRPLKEHFIKYVSYTFVVAGAGLITKLAANQIQTNHQTLTLLLMGMLCLTIPNLIFYLFFRNSKEFNYLSSVLRNLYQNKFLKTYSKKYHIQNEKS